MVLAVKRKHKFNKNKRIWKKRKIDLYDLDLFETKKETIKKIKEKNKKVICYINMGAYEPYRNDSKEFKK